VTWQKSNSWIGGKREICGHVGRAWRTIERWIKEEGFPARKIDGRWESDLQLIDEWRRNRILGQPLGIMSRANNSTLR